MSLTLSRIRFSLQDICPSRLCHAYVPRRQDTVGSVLPGDRWSSLLLCGPTKILSFSRVFRTVYIHREEAKQLLPPLLPLFFLVHPLTRAPYFGKKKKCQQLGRRINFVDSRPALKDNRAQKTIVCICTLKLYAYMYVCTHVLGTTQHVFNYLNQDSVAGDRKPSLNRLK